MSGNWPIAAGTPIETPRPSPNPYLDQAMMGVDQLAYFPFPSSHPNRRLTLGPTRRTHPIKTDTVIVAFEDLQRSLSRPSQASAGQHLDRVASLYPGMMLVEEGMEREGSLLKDTGRSLYGSTKLELAQIRG